MPHLTLEYSRNLASALDVGAVLSDVNRVLAASGHFQEADIKSRAIGFEHVAIGTSGAPRGFVHAKLAILAGRSAEVKRALSGSVLAVLRERIAAPAGLQLQLCVEMLEIDGPSYAKDTVDG